MTITSTSLTLSNDIHIVTQHIACHKKMETKNADLIIPLTNARKHILTLKRYIPKMEHRDTRQKFSQLEMTLGLITINVCNYKTGEPTVTLTSLLTITHVLNTLQKCIKIGKKLSTVVRDVSVISQVSDDADISKTINKLMMKAVGQHDMSIQEVIKLFSSSFQVVTVPLEGSHKVKLLDNEIVTEPAVLDNYAQRQQFQE